MLIYSPSSQVERLAAIGRLWGKAKLFHPHIATQDIDWDGALVAAVARARRADSREDYRAAVDELLLALRDPQTHSEAEPESPTIRPEPSDPDERCFHLVDGVVVLYCQRIANLVSRGASKALETAAPSLAGEIAAASGVILDCRARGASADAVASYSDLDNYLRNMLAKRLQGVISLGSYRFREHSGYAPDFGWTSGGYGSTLSMRTPEALIGQASSDSRQKLSVIIDEETWDFRFLWSGLQCAGLATIVLVQSARGTLALPLRDEGVELETADGVRVWLRTTDFVNPDGRIGWEPDAVVSADGASGCDAALAAALAQIATSGRVAPTPVAADVPLCRREKRYAEMAFPDPDHRLLALFRFWNAVEHFFPYKHLMDRDWSLALAEFIPKFEACAGSFDYEATLAELATWLRDSHVHIDNARVLEAAYGEFAPPLTVLVAEGSTCIAALRGESAERSGLSVGDVVLAVDDEDIEARRERLGRLIASSTPQALRRGVDRLVLRGHADRFARLRVRDAIGEIRMVELARDAPWRTVADPLDRAYLPVSAILPSGHGYIDLVRLERSAVDDAMTIIADTTALIFDIRGYPRGAGFEIARRLLESDRSVDGPVFRRPYWRFDGMIDPSTASSWEHRFSQRIEPIDKPRYRGKVVVLINEDAISQSEHSCMLFAAATDVTFIGSPTAGANGDVTSVALPGDLFLTFTGHDVRHPDGRQLQRVGIQPHIHVEPSLAGLRAKRDEVLDAAVTYLDSRIR